MLRGRNGFEDGRCFVALRLINVTDSSLHRVETSLVWKIFLYKNIDLGT